ncbi:chorismate-binding protein [Bosea sp. BK604]|uniref:chorismate-binding protein n=1 Tax=Bosea sp. BK604 TaxID=2512180 RepID=UPI0010E9E507|nr:chorismate-binding protein [Bosea sp. BK604]TCR65361.1 anthranilate synthase component 1 [Bosea sp. BK604]
MATAQFTAISQEFALDAAALSELARGAVAEARFCMERSAGGGSEPEFTYFGLDVEALSHEAASRHVDGTCDLPGLPDGVPFAGGIFAYFPYDFDSREPDESDAIFWLVRTLLIIDHGASKAILVRLATGAPDEIVERQNLIDRLRTVSARLGRTGSRSALPAERDWRVDISTADYFIAVGKVQDAIERNEISQAILSIGFSKSTSATIETVFEALRERRPSPHVFMVKSGQLALVGASPAMHLLKQGQVLTIETDAGTRQIGGSAEETEAIKHELLNSAKDREEQKMLVDETCMDLRAVAVDAKVSMPVELEVRQLGNVMHLFTVLEATCPAELGAIEAITACLPAAAVTGTPKKAAMATIRAVEGIERGPYGGVVGLIGFDGSVDSAIILRSAWLKGGSIAMRCGGGITHASVAIDEYNECLNKARAIMDAVKEAEGA